MQTRLPCEKKKCFMPAVRFGSPCMRPTCKREKTKTPDNARAAVAGVDAEGKRNEDAANTRWHIRRNSNAMHSMGIHLAEIKQRLCNQPLCEYDVNINVEGLVHRGIYEPFVCPLVLPFISVVSILLYMPLTWGTVTPGLGQYLVTVYVLTFG